MYICVCVCVYRYIYIVKIETMRNRVKRFYEGCFNIERNINCSTSNIKAELVSKNLPKDTLRNACAGFQSSLEAMVEAKDGYIELLSPNHNLADIFLFLKMLLFLIGYWVFFSFPFMKMSNIAQTPCAYIYIYIILRIYIYNSENWNNVKVIRFYVWCLNIVIFALTNM